MWRFTIRLRLHVPVEPVDGDEAAAAAALGTAETVGTEVVVAAELCVACADDEAPLYELLPEATRLERGGPGKDV